MTTMRCARTANKQRWVLVDHPATAAVDAELGVGVRPAIDHHYDAALEKIGQHDAAVAKRCGSRQSCSSRNPRQATVATVLHQPLIETDNVKWRLAGQSATTVLNCAAQAYIVRAFALCRVVR